MGHYRNGRYELRSSHRDANTVYDQSRSGRYYRDDRSGDRHDDWTCPRDGDRRVLMVKAVMSLDNLVKSLPL